MSDPGYEYLIVRDPEFAADDGYDKSYWVYDNEIRRGRYNEGFMSNIGKDGQRLYSIIYRADGWDGSVQEYGKSKEDAIQNAIAKGKLDGDEDIVKIVDLGEPRQLRESTGSFYGIPGAEDVDWAILYKGGKIEPSAFWDELGDIYAEAHPEDSNMDGFDKWCWENTDIVQSVLDDFVRNMDDTDDFGNPLLESKRKLVKEWTAPGRGLQKDDFDVSALEDVLSDLENNSWRWSKWDNGLGGFYLQLKEGLKKPGMFSGKAAKENWKKVEKDEKEIRKNTYEVVGEFCKSEIGEDAFPNIDSFMDCPKKWREYPGSDWGTYLVIYRSDGGRAGLLSDKGDTDEDLSLSRYLPIMANGMKESRKLVKEGAGAGYEVGISSLEIDKVTEVK